MHTFLSSSSSFAFFHGYIYHRAPFHLRIQQGQHAPGTHPFSLAVMYFSSSFNYLLLISILTLVCDLRPKEDEWPRQHRGYRRLRRLFLLSRRIFSHELTLHQLLLLKLPVFVGTMCTYYDPDLSVSAHPACLPFSCPLRFYHLHINFV